MANPLILHCFDEEFRIKEEVVSKLFKNMGGVSDLSSSMDKLYDTLAVMDLEEEFMLRNLDKLDIIKLISRKTLTGEVLLQRLDSAINYILNSKNGTAEERYRIIKNYIILNTSIEEAKTAVIEFMHNIKFRIEKLLEELDIEDMAEMEETNLIKLYHMLNLLYLDNKDTLATTELDILDKLTGAGAIIYLLKNKNAPEINESFNLKLSENDFVFTITLYPDIILNKDHLSKLNTLNDLFLMK